MNKTNNFSQIKDKDLLENFESFSCYIIETISRINKIEKDLIYVIEEIKKIISFIEKFAITADIMIRNVEDIQEKEEKYKKSILDLCNLIDDLILNKENIN